MSERGEHLCLFDDVVLDRDKLCVLKCGQAQPLEPRAFDVLLFLLDNRSRVVEKRELFDQIWGQSYVSDSALTQEIKNIRRAIGDRANSPRYIATVPKHGYRFIADVIEIDSSSARDELVRQPTIAVLTFLNRSDDAQIDDFCLGLSEELIRRLTRLKELHVVVSDVSKKHDPREVGQMSEMGFLLQGSVHKVADQLRVSVQLIRTADGQYLWTEHYDRNKGNEFAIQDELSVAITKRLRKTLLGLKYDLN